MRKLRIIVVWLMGLLLFLEPPLYAANINLPNLGGGASNGLTLYKEYELGDNLVKALRSQLPILYDPLLNEYLDHLVNKLALSSPLQDKKLHILLLNMNDINAWAAPGGIIAIYTGLIDKTENEAQLAAVIAHELGHISQRHYARIREQEAQQKLPLLAGIFSGLLVLASGGASLGLAIALGSLGGTLSEKLSFSRAFEDEADSVGIHTLAKANYDPQAMVSMLETLQEQARFSGTIPAFLSTHPTNQFRITHVQSLAKSIKEPHKKYLEDTQYFELMKIRAQVLTADNINDLLNSFQTNLADQQLSPQKKIELNYGAFLASVSLKQFEKANDFLSFLLRQQPNNAIFLYAKVNYEIETKQYEVAIQTIKKALNLYPDHFSLKLLNAQLNSKRGAYNTAITILKALLNIKPTNPYLLNQLSLAYGGAGKIGRAHETQAEYLLQIGDIDEAVTQLRYALKLAKGQAATQARLKATIQEYLAFKKKIMDLNG